MHRKLRLSVFILLLALPLHLHAQDSVSFSDPVDLISFWSENVKDIAYCNDLAFVALSSEIRVLDLSAPDHPVETAMMFTDSYQVKSLVTNGNYVYVLHLTERYSGRISVVDVSNPNSLAIVGEIEISYRSNTMQIHDNLLMIGGGEFTIMSIENPSSPEFVSSTVVSYDVFGFCVHDTLVYTVGQERINVINIANLEDIRSLYLGDDVTSTDCAVYNGYLYATYRYPVDDHVSTAGVVFSLENPAAPELLGTFRLYSHITQAFYSVENYGEYLLLHGRNRVVLCEVGESPQLLEVVGEYSNTGRTFITSTLNDNTLFTIVDHWDITGLQSFSIEETSITPQGLTCWYEGTYQTHEQRGDYVYAFVSPFDLFCFDISDPDNPVTVSGSFRGEGMAPYELTSYQCDEYIYTITGDGVLSVYDTSDPENVAVVWSESIGPDDINYPDIQGCGDLLVINRGNSVLEGWSVENRREPVLVWSHDTARCTYIVNDEYLYKFVSTTLVIYSLDGFNPPEEVSRSFIYLGCSATPASHGDYLYIPSSCGVVKTNISDPVAPRSEALLPNGAGRTNGVDIQFPFAYVLVVNRIQVFDIWDPVHPRLTGTELYSEPPVKMTLQNDVVVVGTETTLQFQTVCIPNTADDDIKEFVPTEYSLLTAYPNPFNGAINLTVMLQERSDVLMQVYSIEGRLITTLMDHTMEKGTHRVTWTPDNCSSGVYFVSLKTNETSAIQKIIYTR